MATEYIRRQDAFDAVDARIDELMTHPEYRRKRWDIDLLGIIRNISAIKPADVAPVVHGKWIEEWWHGEKTRKCSVCNLTQTVNAYNGEVKFKYCPYCGAKMDKE